MLTQLTLENLKDLDRGVAALAWAHEMEKVLRDCDGRAHDDSARVVTLKTRVVPQLDKQTGRCSNVMVEMEVSSAMPSQKTETYQMRMSRDKASQRPTLLFQPDSPDNVDQMTTDEVINTTTGEVSKNKG